MKERYKMFTNRTPDGRNNIVGVKVAELRKAQGKRFSQRAFSDKLRELGLDIDKNQVQRIESGQRFVTDIELGYLAKALGTSIACLLGGEYNGAYI